MLALRICRVENCLLSGTIKLPGSLEEEHKDVCLPIDV